MATDTKNPGDKTLSVASKTLTLKPRTETGVVRQSFSHGRSKAVVVEEVARAIRLPASRSRRLPPRRRLRRTRTRSARRCRAAWRCARAEQALAGTLDADQAVGRSAAHAHQGRAGSPRPCAWRRQGARGRGTQDRRGRGEDPRRARRDREVRARRRRSAQAPRGRAPPPRRRDQAPGRRGRQEALRW